MLNIKKGGSLMIGDDVKITVFESRGSGAREGYRVGIEAPKNVAVLRREVYERYNNITPDCELLTVADL